MVGLLAGNDWQIVAGGGCWQWLLVVAGSGGPIVAVECGEGKRKEEGREKKTGKKKEGRWGACDNGSFWKMAM